MFRFLPVFTELKRSSVIFFIRGGVFLSHFPPNALVYKKSSPTYLGTISNTLLPHSVLKPWLKLLRHVETT